MAEFYETGFDDLSTRTQKLILSYLDLNTLLNFRLVNRNFFNNVNSLKIDSLTVNNRQSKYHDDYDAFKYFLTNDLIAYSTRFSTTNLHFFESNLIKMMLSRIRRMCIDGQQNILQEGCYSSENDFDLEVLNQFQSLEALEVNLTQFALNRTLRLDNLLMLSFNKCYYFANLRLETPSLFAFRCEAPLEFIRFVYPENITHLFIDYEISLKLFIRQFVNLVYLFVYDRFIISSELPEFSYFTNLEQMHLDTAKLDILQTIWNKKRKENLNFKVYINGFRVDRKEDTRPFTSKYDDEVVGAYQLRNFTEFLIDNYSRTCEVMHDITICQLDYNELMQYELPNDFHDKIINIRAVNVSGSDDSFIDQKEFISFLKQIKGLNELKIQQVSFDESFYRNLNAMAPFLKMLTINGSESTGSFDFLIDCKRLMVFKTNLKINVTLVRNLFNELELFNQLSFRHRNQYFEISRDGRKFRVTGCDDLKFNDLDFIVLFLTKLKP